MFTPAPNGPFPLLRANYTLVGTPIQVNIVEPKLKLARNSTTAAGPQPPTPNVYREGETISICTYISHLITGMTTDSLACAHDPDVITSFTRSTPSYSTPVSQTCIASLAPSTTPTPIPTSLAPCNGTHCDGKLLIGDTERNCAVSRLLCPTPPPSPTPTPPSTQCFPICVTYESNRAPGKKLCL